MTANRVYDILSWDTDFFGWPVARIHPATLTTESLQSILAELRHHGVQLVYWATASDGDLSHRAAESAGGILVDKKSIFAQTHGADGEIPERVESYTDATPSTALQALAIQAGLYSRFRIDPHFGETKFKELYTIWLERSIKREIAQDVLVIRDHTLPHHPEIAFATVGEKNGRGDIGLVAVDKNYRGQGLGTTIVQGAVGWFKQHDYAASQVVTQGDNAAACRLYAKCGYTLESVEWWYHFWL